MGKNSHDRDRYWHEQNEHERGRAERQGAAVLEDLGKLAWAERRGLDTTAQREALGLDGTGC